MSSLMAVCRHLRQVAEADDVWARCAASEALPSFELPEALNAGLSRGELRRTVGALRAGAVAGPAALPLRLGSFDLARRLASTLSRVRARTLQEANSPRHGSAEAAVVAVAKFHFPVPLAGGLAFGGVVEPSITSRCVTVDLPGGAGGCEAWELRLHLRTPAQGGAALLCARRCRKDQGSATVGKQRQDERRREDVEDASPRGLCVDVHSVSDALVVQLVDTHLPPDGGWAKSEGLCSCLGDAVAALEDGLLAVVCVRRAAPPPQLGAASDVEARPFRRARTR